MVSNSFSVFHNTACKKKGITGPASFIQTIVCGVDGITFSRSSSCCQDYLTSFGLKTWSFGRVPPAWCWDPTGPWEGGAPAIGKGCSRSRKVVEVPWSPCPWCQQGKGERREVRLTCCGKGTEVSAANWASTLLLEAWLLSVSFLFSGMQTPLHLIISNEV